MAVQLSPRLINVHEYHLMIKAGILTETDRVELINGQILEMSPIGSKHVAMVNRISNLLMQSLGNKAIISVQNPVDLAKNSEPEPDIVILQPRKDFYSDQLAKPEDILLIIEVADTSLAFDREIKLPLYAAAGIPEYWLVNIEKKEIEAYRLPQDDIYTLREIVRMDKQLKIYGLGLSINSNNLLG